MRHPVIAPVLLASLLFFLSSCAAPRYASYQPPSSTGPAWKVKAEKTVGGIVTITIDDQEILKGQYAIFSEKEFRGKYQGREVVMILRKSPEASGTVVFECLLYVENTQIGHFRWL